MSDSLAADYIDTPMMEITDMKSPQRRTFTHDFKITVVRQVETGKTIAEVARAYDIHPTLLSRWKQQIQRTMPEQFPQQDGGSLEDVRIAELERIIGQLTVQNAFLKRALARLEEKRPWRGPDMDPPQH